MDQALHGKTALVTGAARRVGAAIARHLHAAGANLVLHYRGAEADAGRLEAEMNAARAGSAVKVKGDLMAPIAPQALVNAALDRYKRLDILVNNASSFYPTAVGEIEAAHWEELAGSNLRAPLFLAQAAAPHLAKVQGAIVNITDIHAERPLKGYVVYSIAKAGLAALTRSLALELAPVGARERGRAGNDRLARRRPVRSRRARAHHRHHAARGVPAVPRTLRRRCCTCARRPSSPARCWRWTAGARCFPDAPRF